MQSCISDDIAILGVEMYGKGTWSGNWRDMKDGSPHHVNIKSSGYVALYIIK
ncbi:predicted protein [Sclerotinia sclerotiorum 1980 UF-70]|uniref:Uncharacterized protein n=1 Tax=Sclerotinia sclerotiorum (strain ATCC 18683 / 1980 / Ss-1) TaxID=665079 RepID=A7EL88_SCLS1|nr:predicted protein [Sclerotinia sclerotiorum 1980 UF-70]EDO03604.1 predicted protein [Sclerotinia sclerotiorum 1980 UF-70]